MGTRSESTSGSGTTAKCGDCQRRVGSADWRVCCTKCDRAFHYKCCGFDDGSFKAYEKIQALVPWYCKRCQSCIATLEDRVSTLEQQMRQNGASVGEDVGTEARGITADVIERIVTKVLDTVLPKILDVARDAATEAAEAEGKKITLWWWVYRITAQMRTMM